MPRIFSGKLVRVAAAALFATAFGIAATPGHAGMGVGKKGDGKGPASPPGDAGGTAKKTPGKGEPATEGNTNDGGAKGPAKGTAKGK